ncbi:MAG: hypothetical protein SFV20_01655 [Sphingopyxis sp.]|nr:hypothetical protein [Sphingopyxis sp.]
MLALAAAVATCNVSVANAASYVCSAKVQDSCLNGKKCAKSTFDEADYFIIDIDKEAFRECRTNDCRNRDVLVWQPAEGGIVVSHRDIPRVTRIVELTYTKDSDLVNATYTQTTLSSVMTVVQSGTCFRQIVVPPNSLK